MTQAHNIPSALRKTLQALADISTTLRPTPQPRLIMTLLVKNEEEMLEQHLRYHRMMGVDAFIVTDNNSTDRTPHILQRYREKGWIAHIINETATDYDQKRWVDRMVWLAKTRYAADWVVNADADELWWHPSGSLKTEMQAGRANVLRCEVRNVFPEEGEPWTAWRRTVRSVPEELAPRYDLSRYSLFGRAMQKVAHRTAGYLQISMGNHKVKMLPALSAASGIVVFHYNVRSRRQFVTKMENGGRQLEQHRGRHGGRHWRYFYTLYKEGRLDEEYNRVCGLNHLPELQRDGYLLRDPALDAVAARLTMPEV